MDGHRRANSAKKLDATSKLRIRAFAFKILLVIPVAVVFALQHQVTVFRALGYFCFWFSLFSGVAALVQRHKSDAASLTAWDEMAAFLGLALVASFLGALAG